MTSREYHLYIDELGVHSLRDIQTPLYVLVGCAVNKEYREELKIVSDQIKFKYWGHTNVVFHSMEIGRNINNFAIFYKNQDLKAEFIKDLLVFLDKCPIIILPVVIDKDRARKYQWNDIKIINESSRKLMYNFICFLISDSRKGKVNVEISTFEKDKLYLESFVYFQSPGSKEFGKDFKQIQETLTSINFVTKKNNDIEEQIADIFAYAVKCKYLSEVKNKNFKKGSYEDHIVKILDKKLFKIPKETGLAKKRHFEKIEQFIVLPKLKRTGSS